LVSQATEEEIENVEKHFVKILEQRRQENPEGVIKIQKDQVGKTKMSRKYQFRKMYMVTHTR